MAEKLDSKKIGLWSQDNPVKPWVYRRKGNK